MLINLLPWRQVQYQKQVKKFYQLIIFTLLANSILFLIIHKLMSATLQQQLKVNAVLQQQKIQLAQSLQLSEPQFQQFTALKKSNRCLLNFWQQLALTIPPQVYLYNIKQGAQFLVIKGKTKDFNNIASLLDNLAKQTCIVSPRLGNLTELAAELDFTIHFSLQDFYVKQ